MREIATKGMDGILSQEPTVARHALAVALHLAQHNAPQLLDTQKDLATVVAATCGMYEVSGEHSIHATGVCNLLSLPWLTSVAVHVSLRDHVMITHPSHHVSVLFTELTMLPRTVM